MTEEIVREITSTYHLSDDDAVYIVESVEIATTGSLFGVLKPSTVIRDVANLLTAKQEDQAEEIVRAVADRLGYQIA